jgi:hypothetical protein
LEKVEKTINTYNEPSNEQSSDIKPNKTEKKVASKGMKLGKKKPVEETEDY